MLDHLRALAARATTELFGDYGVALRPADGGPRRDEVLYCGVIGFTGQGIAGSLVLAGTGPTLALSNPVAGPRRDWAGELANQLAGRLKNLLLREGVELRITTPVVLRGRQLALGASPEDEPVPAFFEGPTGSVVLWLDVEAEPGFARRPEASVTPLDEGTAVLF